MARLFLVPKNEKRFCRCSLRRLIELRVKPRRSGRGRIARTGVTKQMTQTPARPEKTVVSRLTDSRTCFTLTGWLSKCKELPRISRAWPRTRARAAGDVQRLEQLHAEITAQLEAARAEVTSCGLLIRKFDRQLDPTKIPAIQAWRRHYGKRGEFRAAILRMLEASWPESVSTLELAAQLQLDFINSSPTPADHNAFPPPSQRRPMAD